MADEKTPEEIKAEQEAAEARSETESEIASIMSEQGDAAQRKLQYRETKITI
jgi:hypothetical protein